MLFLQSGRTGILLVKLEMMISPVFALATGEN
jgi:hypothetical protein